MSARNSWKGHMKPTCAICSRISALLNVLDSTVSRSPLPVLSPMASISRIEIIIARVPSGGGSFSFAAAIATCGLLF